jgi:hypothetical protein
MLGRLAKLWLYIRSPVRTFVLFHPIKALKLLLAFLLGKALFGRKKSVGSGARRAVTAGAAGAAGAGTGGAEASGEAAAPDGAPDGKAPGGKAVPG